MSSVPRQVQESNDAPLRRRSVFVFSSLKARIFRLAAFGGVLLLVGVLAGCKKSADDNAAKATGTNAKPAAAQAIVRTNGASVQQQIVVRTPPGAPPPNAARPTVRTNIVGGPNSPAVARAATASARTNAVAGQPGTAKSAASPAKAPGFMDSAWFYPVVMVVAIILSFGGVYLYQLFSAKKAKDDKFANDTATPHSKPLVKKTRRAPVYSCNVLHLGPEARRLWQFAARGRGFTLSREQTSVGAEPLPARAIAKDFRALWQRKLNIAWLPPEQVFLRVVQLPMSDFEETVSMVDLQLEKLSPMPLGQIVWSIQVLHHSEGNMQTVIVMMVARSVVEEFLGKLEAQGFLADRLEFPRLDQLMATVTKGDGAWIYPETTGIRNIALVAWWYGGVLQSLALINLAQGNQDSLREQLVQLSWAGELDGWLTSPPSWHLVADAPTAAEWEPPLRAALDQPLEIIPALSLPELAAKTATRAVQTEPQANLLPPEFSTRYHQQFVDRLWMGSVAAVILLYVAGVLIYFGRLQVENFRVGRVDDQIARVGPIYTNAMELKAKTQVLKERQELKWAALDCWKQIALLLPDGFTLEGFNLTDGKRLALNGTAPVGQEKRLIDFESDLRKVPGRGNQPMFDAGGGDRVTFRRMAGDQLSWSCVLELKRSEEL